MIEIYVCAAVLVIAGAAIGIIAVVALGIHREERDLSLTSDTTDPVARGARKLNGVYTRIPGVIQQVSHYRQTAQLSLASTALKRPEDTSAISYDRAPSTV